MVGNRHGFCIEEQGVATERGRLIVAVLALDITYEPHAKCR